MVCTLDNIKCEGEDLFLQAELCHYSRDFRGECAAPISDNEQPVVSINNDTSVIICTCKFRGGERVCDDC